MPSYHQFTYPLNLTNPYQRSTSPFSSSLPFNLKLPSANPRHFPLLQLLPKIYLIPTIYISMYLPRPSVQPHHVTLPPANPRHFPLLQPTPITDFPLPQPTIAIYLSFIQLLYKIFTSPSVHPYHLHLPSV